MASEFTSQKLKGTQVSRLEQAMWASCPERQKESQPHCLVQRGPEYEEKQLDIRIALASRGDSIWGVDKVEEAENIVTPGVAWYLCLTYRLDEEWAVGHSKPTSMTCASIWLLGAVINGRDDAREGHVAGGI